MDIELSPENARFVNEQLTVGAYADPNAVLNAGLELLRRREQIVAKIDRGCEQLESGDYTEYTREELRGRFDELKQRATRSLPKDTQE